MITKVQKLRGKISEIKTKIDEVESGSFRIPKAQAIARLEEHLGLAEAAGLGTIDNYLFGFCYPSRSPDHLIVIHPHDPTGPNNILTALAPAAIRARLVALLEEKYADESDVFDPADRGAWLATKRAELLELEIADYRESIAAREPQRSDLDARILLGLV